MVDREVDGPVWVVLGRFGGLCVRSWAALGAFVGGPGPSWAEKWPKPEREQGSQQGPKSEPSRSQKSVYDLFL